MIYADFSYYQGAFYGDLIQTENEFTPCAARASRYIDRITLGKAETYATLHPDDKALKNACCAAADQYLLIAKAKASIASDDGEIASESVGSHSVSYRSGIESSATLEAELRDIVSSYLVTTGLLYRGVSYVHASHNYADIG